MLKVFKSEASPLEAQQCHYLERITVLSRAKEKEISIFDAVRFPLVSSETPCLPLYFYSAADLICNISCPKI